MPIRYVEPAQIFTQRDIPFVGGKAAHLAELMKAGFPVPECFFVTVEAYKKFIEANGLHKPISEIITQVDYGNPDSLTAASNKIKTLMEQSRVPLIIRDSILKAYRELGGAPVLPIEFVKAGRELLTVAARSSAVLENSAKASNAGQQETYLNVRGDDALISAVQGCWASLFTARAICYRHAHDLPQDISTGVIVQRMINSETSGVTFTVDPRAPTDGANKIVNEASWGLGETIVQGHVDPDQYVVDKTTGQILSKIIGTKKSMRMRDATTGKTIVRDVPPERMAAQVLSDEQIVTLSAYCKRIEQFYNGQPQNIEWATERGKIYILQTRAVTALGKKEPTATTPTGATLLRGMVVSPGIATGAVKMVQDFSDLGKVGPGDVLVTVMTSPNIVLTMEKSSAIVTDQGGATCHAAILSRELGIPSVVGTNTATQVLKDGQKITIDAINGTVHTVEVEPPKELPPAVPAADVTFPDIVEPVAGSSIIATEIKVSMAPSDIEASIKADGVGLMKLEQLFNAGMHPIDYIRLERGNEMTKMIVDGTSTVSKAFTSKPVWVRMLDVDDSGLLRAQLESFKQLNEQGQTNVGIMISSKTGVDDLRLVKSLAREMCVPASMKFGIAVETPATALAIEDYCQEGIGFVLFDYDRLCGLTLGNDRPDMAVIHPAVQFLLRRAIRICKKYGVKTSVCGEAPSDHPDIIEFLIRTGVDSISVNMDALDKVRGWAAAIERRMLLDKVRR